MVSALTNMSVCNQFLLIVLWFVSFCEKMHNTLNTCLNNFVNKRLEGVVLYIALYTKDDNYYALLYDITSLYDRLFLVLMSYINRNYFKKHSIFSIKDADENFNNLAHLLIDVGVVSYIHKGTLVHKLLIEDAKAAKNIKHPVIYAVASDENGKEVNLTPLFNVYSELVFSTYFNCKDVVSVLTNRLQSPLSSNKFELRVMSEITYDEHVFKGNDNIISIIGKDD